MKGLAVLAALLLAVPAGAAERRIRLATTTSVENTGLLDLLLPAFKAESGIEVQAVAVGTGKALKLAENGDVDLVLVHDPEAEEAFMAKGFGRDRTALFRNEFVLVGPAEDPAGTAKAKDLPAAFARIAEQGSFFISRGDRSGTHARELSVWRKAGISPSGAWYLEAGQGMGPCLVIAGEKRAYALTDTATFASFAEKTGLSVLFKAKPPLVNPYSLILVDPKVHPAVSFKEAGEFLAWMKSKRARSLVAGFKKEGKTLFVPGR
ncbi:MAG: substrate-binding domain-containing protein [Elusimicrobia bacterium]|nr:substrate-binding domain-containing protein [Elusimicrobiota bacterium]